MDTVPYVLGWGGELKTITPSRWSALMQCVAKGWSDMLVLDGELPKPPPSRSLLVGRLHHRFMELAVTAYSAQELEAQIENEISALQKEVTRYPHLRRAGSVSGWMEINTSASLALRLLEMREGGADGGAIRVERDLESKDGVLFGRPDLFRIQGSHASLKEYKTGTIRDEKGKVRPAYLDQITLYAALIFDNYEVETVAASLDSLGGDRHETEISRKQAQELCERVRRVVTEVNDRARSAQSFAELGQTSQDGCNQCALQPICTSFKVAQDELALEGDQFLAEGTIESVGAHSGGALTNIRVHDEHRKTALSLSVPSAVASEMSPNQRYQLLYLRRRGVTLEWGNTSRALIHG